LPPEKILPENCVVALTAPDFARFQESMRATPWWQAWNDPAAAPMRTNFWNEARAAGGEALERHLPGPWSRLVELPTGQVTLALVHNGWLTNSALPPGFLIICDVGARSNLLSSYLQSLRQPRNESVTPLPVQKIGGLDFTEIKVPLERFPRSVARFLTGGLEPQPIDNGTNAPPAPEPARMKWLVGQYDSYFLGGTDVASLERVLDRLTNGPSSSLADNPLFQAAQASGLKKASGYAWVHLQPLLGLLLNPAVAAPAAVDLSAGNALSSARGVLRAAGVGSVQQVVWTLEGQTNGMRLQTWLGTPETSRQGLIRMLPGEGRELPPPPYVPTGVESFRRWRLDGAKTWLSLEGWLAEVSPQMKNIINFLLDSVNTAERETTPDFDVRRQLMGNLGDDWVTYAKNAPGTTNDIPPTILVVGATNSDQVARAIKPIFLVLSPHGGAAETREYLGRVVYTVPFPSIPVPGIENAPLGSKLHYTAVTGYVAFCEDAPLLEEFVRDFAGTTNRLSADASFSAAKDNFLGPGNTFLAWTNDREAVRTGYNAWKTGAALLPVEGLLGTILGLIGHLLPETSAKRLLDPELAPPFDSVQQHFYFSIGAAGGDSNGFWNHTLYLPGPASIPVPPPTTPQPAPDK